MLQEMSKKQDQYKQEADEFRDRMQKTFVTVQEFAPIRVLVYGATGIILSAVLGALIALVIKSNP